MHVCMCEGPTNQPTTVCSPCRFSRFLGARINIHNSSDGPRAYENSYFVAICRPCGAFIKRQISWCGIKATCLPCTTARLNALHLCLCQTMRTAAEMRFGRRQRSTVAPRFPLTSLWLLGCTTRFSRVTTNFAN